MSAKFETRGEDLYVNGHKVIEVYESSNRWYWFATEETEPGIYFGFVQGFEEEWGYFSKEERVDSQFLLLKFRRCLIRLLPKTGGMRWTTTSARKRRKNW